MIQIGAPLAHDFSNPLGVMSDCHRRIEHFLDLLITVTVQARGRALSAEQRDAMDVALRYFEEAEPKHTADEEESLFPRLRASQHPKAPEAVALVDVLAHDHQVAQAHHARVGTLAHVWLTDGRLPTAAARELAERLDALAAIYRTHIPVEDGELIPLARRILDAAETATLGREMAARRGIDATRLPHRTATAGAPARQHAARQPSGSST
jgi:hemerythrin-like domain-containing protein